MDDLELHPVRIMEEEGVVTRRVVVLSRPTLDLDAVLARPAGPVVDNRATAGREGDVM